MAPPFEGISTHSPAKIVYNLKALDVSKIVKIMPDN
jgi:hypothetical protein